ncbi:MAG: hypothetical protein L0Y66_26560, partial [Myxococcaceae bacterium]|nr:hypothetical protein [Myxococcaceae bacterium]
MTYDVWVDPGAGLQVVAHQLSAGTSLGFAWRVSRTLRLYPEVSVRIPVTPRRDDLGGGLGLQGGLGLLWGG